ncbi:MAG: hypothetical protein EAZ42_10455 [Verrucomicrobia bacterium]|nr:MAG: hypothetical protein EAZ42_10455 [Verrucomicrobiota bacterium]
MISFILEILFFGFCGWLGHVTVKIVTLGKVDLDYGNSSESVITEWIGVGVFLAIAMLVSFLINMNRDRSSTTLIPESRQGLCDTIGGYSLPSHSQQTIQQNDLSSSIEIYHIQSQFAPLVGGKECPIGF